MNGGWRRGVSRHPYVDFLIENYFKLERYSTTAVLSVLLTSFAMSSGVFPLLSLALTSAPLETRNLTTSILSQLIFAEASDYAKKRGIIIADTKFEWGWTVRGKDGDLSDCYLWLIDEVLTPDSSRFWDAATYEPGKDQPSLDKDNMRRYYRSIGYNGDGAAPPPPEAVIEATRNAYIDVFTRLVGRQPEL